MTSRFFDCKIAIRAIAACISIALMASFAEAQEIPPLDSNQSLSSVSGANAKLVALTKTLAQRYQVRIVTAPDIEAPSDILIPAKEVPLAAALNQITRQMKNAAWQRLYLKRDGALHAPEKLAAAVRALNRLSQTELALENPPKERGLLLFSLPLSPATNGQGQTDDWDTKPIYLLYNTALPADGKTAFERVAAMQQQQLKLMAQLPPEQRPNPIRLGMRMMQAMSGSGHEGVMRAIGEAGMSAWQTTAPDAREEMIQQFMRTVQSSPPLKPDSEPNAATEATPSKNYLDALRAMAETLAKKHRVRILIDPGLYVPAPPTRPSEQMTLAQALDALTKSVPDAAWRSIYQKPPLPASPSLAIKNVAHMARMLENLTPLSLRVENPTLRQSLALQSDLPASSLRAKAAAQALTAQPTYLLYATQEELDSSLPVAQRLEQVQMQQMELLLCLNAEQMTQAMADAVAQYAGGKGDGQSQMMRMPIMAVLMGTWFPRKAKEDKAASPPP